MADKYDIYTLKRTKEQTKKAFHWSMTNHSVWTLCHAALSESVSPVEAEAVEALLARLVDRVQSGAWILLLPTIWIQATTWLTLKWPSHYTLDMQEHSQRNIDASTYSTDLYYAETNWQSPYRGKTLEHCDIFADVWIWLKFELSPCLRWNWELIIFFLPRGPGSVGSVLKSAPGKHINP